MAAAAVSTVIASLLVEGAVDMASFSVRVFLVGEYLVFGTKDRFLVESSTSMYEESSSESESASYESQMTLVLGEGGFLGMGILLGCFFFVQKVTMLSRRHLWRKNLDMISCMRGIPTFEGEKGKFGMLIKFAVQKPRSSPPGPALKASRTLLFRTSVVQMLSLIQCMFYKTRGW